MNVDNIHLEIKPKKKTKRRKKKAVDNRRRNYPCKICGFRFLKNQHLVKHKQLHLRPAFFTCRYCNKIYKFEKNYSYHLSKCHNSLQKSYILKQNDLSKGTIDEPIEISSSDTSGTQSPEGSAKNNNISTICRRSSNNDNTYYANKQQKSSIESQRVATTSKSNKLRRCYFEGCAKSYYYKESYNYHIKSHLNDKPNVCFCGKRYIKRSQLSKHLSFAHRPIINNKCPYCNYESPIESFYFKHLRSHPEF